MRYADYMIARAKQAKQEQQRIQELEQEIAEAEAVTNILLGEDEEGMEGPSQAQDDNMSGGETQ